MARTLDIDIDVASLKPLQRSGSSLYVCRVVRSPDAAGIPLYWRRQVSLSPRTTLEWTDGLRVWTSTQASTSRQFLAGFQAAITPGQTLDVGIGGVGTVMETGPSAAVSFINRTTTPYTCGLAADGALFCGFPLHGEAQEVIAPVDRLLVWFGTETVAPGTVAGRCTGPALLVDFTGRIGSRVVAFDIDRGWNFRDQVWATRLPTRTPVKPHVIVHTNSLASPRRGAGGQRLV